MSRIRSALGCSLAAALLGGCTPDLNWRDWRSEAGVVQLFPCKPVRQQRKLVLAGRDLQLVLQVCDVDGVTWAQAHADVQDPAAVGAVLESLVASAHANLGTTRGPVLPQAVQGATPQSASGRYQLQGRAPDGRAIEEVMLVFAKGTVVVQVTALGVRLPVEAVDTFISSVRTGA